MNDSMNLLKKESEARVLLLLTEMMNSFISKLNNCRDEYDYFGLMVAVGIFAKSIDERFRKDLMKDLSSAEEINDYFKLKDECVHNLYKDLVKVN